MHGPKGSVTIAEIASIAHLRMHELPPGVEPLLDATATYEPSVSTGVYSYATHGAVVIVDLGDRALWSCSISRLRIAARWSIRCLSRVRSAAVWQGIGTALYEEIPRRTGPAARCHVSRLPPASRAGVAVDPDRAPAHAGDGDRIRHEGDGRGRCRRATRGNCQRGARCVGGIGRGGERDAVDGGAGAHGDYEGTGVVSGLSVRFPPPRWVNLSSPNPHGERPLLGRLRRFTSEDPEANNRPSPSPPVALACRNRETFAGANVGRPRSSPRRVRPAS